MSGFLEKNLSNINSIIQQSIFTDDYFNKKGFLQGINPSTKTLSALILIFACGFAENIYSLIIFNLISVILAFFSNIPVGFFLKRVWLFLPLFTGIIVVPQLFNIISPGLPFLSIIKIPRYNIDISITVNGVYSGLLLISRVAASLSFTLLLILTTKWNEILSSFNILKIPQGIITVLSMTYRYIFVFLNTAGNMFLSRKSRTLGKVTSKQNRNYIGSLTGVLFLKSFSFSESVYLAMLSRGFSGKICTMEKQRVAGKDFVILSICLFISLLILIVPKLLNNLAL